MKFFLDPGFRFDVSRSIYKAMLKFLAIQNQQRYVVQPLPVDNFSAVFNKSGKVRLKWKPKTDRLEESAQPQKYIVYTRIEDKNFDNGFLVDDNSVIINDIIPATIYSFKITAVNDGGESFPSEILSICIQDSIREPVLIINGFDRISGPATIYSESFTGFVNFLDAGVADRFDPGYVGTQINYDSSSRWSDDDAPGFGTSYADMETNIIPGNTFDFVYVHGRAIREAGYSFVSASDEAIMHGDVNLTDYYFVDLILGEEKKTASLKYKDHIKFKTFPEELRLKINNYCQSGGNLFISGAYVGTDLFHFPPIDTMDITFANNTLKYFWRTNHAVKNGNVYAVDSTFSSIIPNFSFNTAYNPDIYTVEAPDAIEPSESGAATILRYTENNMSAAVGYCGDYDVIVFGFPFETISDEKERLQVMQAVFRFFEQD
jgi:hypothetical protein